MEVGSSSLPGTTSPQGNVPQEDVSLPGTTLKYDIFTFQLPPSFGGLAQLARAPALQAGGQRFESVILHVSACFLTAVGNHNYHLSPVNYPLRKSSLTY